MSAAARSPLRMVAHFASWRNWGILRHNAVIENAFFLLLPAVVRRPAFGGFARDYFLFLAFSCLLISFGYLLNDAVDRERDAPFRADNPFAQYGAHDAAWVVGLAFAANLPLVVYFTLKHPLFAPIWLVWVATAILYSVPGAYLKGRGWLGLVDVALALRTLPMCLAWILFPTPPEPAILLALAYVTCRGLGADTAHQLLHLEEDGANQVATLTVRIGPARSTALLRRLLRLERFLLLALAGCLALRLLREDPFPIPAAILGLNFAALLALMVYAEVHVVQGLSVNPHRADYGRDVFYLLHKSYPKVILPLLLVMVLALRDPAWLLLGAPQVFVYRSFSPRRILGLFQIQPIP